MFSEVRAAKVRAALQRAVDTGATWDDLSMILNEVILPTEVAVATVAEPVAEVTTTDFDASDPNPAASPDIDAT